MTRDRLDSIVLQLVEAGKSVEVRALVGDADQRFKDALGLLLDAIGEGEVGPTAARKKIAENKANPTRDGWYRWTVEFEVHKTWVMDGFEFTDERAKSILANELSYAHGSELRAKVLTGPPDAAIAKEQGYPNVDAWRETRR